jgi:uncharacterized ubiquitin-like protein YukD
MSKTQVQPTIDLRNFIVGIADLQLTELERLSNSLNAYIARKKSVEPQNRIKQLLKLINQTVLTGSSKVRYEILIDKLEDDSLSKSEHSEFLKLVEEEEELCNVRLKYLIELSQLKNVTLPELMIELDLIPHNYA